MNIFEELMSKHQTFSDEALTESIKRRTVKFEAKKINYKQIKVESLKVLEGADIDELDAQFAVDVDDKEDKESEDKDEVVLVIDPELPYDEEVPEDAAQNLVGDYVYKCPVCGANYVCDCNTDNSNITVDEQGIPTECPICNDDAEQILIGQIAPADEVKDEDEGEMEPVDVDDAEDNEEDLEDFEETEEEEEVLEDSLKRKPLPRRRIKTESKKRVKESVGDEVGKYQKWVDYDMKHYGKISERTDKFLKDAGLEVVKDDYGDYEVIAKEESVKAESKKSSKCPECGKDPCVCEEKKDEGCGKKSRKKKVKEWVDRDDLKRQVEEKTQKYLEYDSKALEDLVAKSGQDIGNLEIDEIAEIVAEEVLNEIYGDSYYGADSYETARETVLDLMKDFSSQFESVKAKKPLRKKVKEDIEDDEEVDVNLDLDTPTPEIPPVEKEAPKVEVNANTVEIVLDDVRFNKLMGQMLKENYKNNPIFKVTSVKANKKGTLTLEYVVLNNKKEIKGKFVAEGFNRTSRVMKLKAKDQGAFTESFTKTPAFVIECVRIRNKVIPTMIKYNFTKKVNESLYRVKGEIKNSK